MKLRVFLAYLTLVLMWSTTPLAVKWSGQGPGFLFGAMARMSIGWVCVLLLMALLRHPFPWHRRALRNYLAVFVYLGPSMLALHWAAQFIPSGWVAVVFGLGPMITAVMAAVWLGEPSLSPVKLASYVLGLGGLGLLSGSALDYHATAIYGIVGVLLAAGLQAGSTVWAKRVGADLPVLTQVAGGLCLAVPVYWLAWAIADGCPPARLPWTSLGAIAYLGLLATPLGFTLYFFLLKHLQATQVSLISLLTPVLALLVGYWSNGEALTLRVAAGTLLILTAVFAHQRRFASKMPKRMADSGQTRPPRPTKQ